MPRPRFEKLEPERRAAILGVAAEEFAVHGYEASSYNRIIERSGLSKGAIYYYFDDKEDLYATVLRDAMQRLVIESGDVGSTNDPEAFWAEFEVWYVRSLQRFQAEPHAVGLARSLVKALSRGAATGVLADLRAFARGFMVAFVQHGQAVGAIRSDLPDDLILAVLTALEEAIDLWLGDRIGTMTEAEMHETAAMLTRLYRRVAEAPHDAETAPTKKRPTKTAPTKKQPTKKTR
ncbi:MAG: TetR/AcrR family transcriptional regulator [Deltaproteobacteria bacterium]|nr:TetR/AcrR family transcriptional regulator [Deltaproteobacteria bacterium]